MPHISKISILALMLYSFCMGAQVVNPIKEKNRVFVLNKIDKRTAKNIRNSFIQINDTLWCSKYETNMYDFASFINSPIQTPGKISAKELYLRDSLRRVAFPTDPCFSKPTTTWNAADFVTYNDAISYCAALDSVLPAALFGYKKIKFTLPSVKEWYLCYNYAIEGYSVYDFQKYLDNIHCVKVPQSKILSTDTSVYVDTSDIRELKLANPCTWPVDKGAKLNGSIIHLLGNVSEMLIEEGYTLGGSYNDFTGDCASLNPRKQNNVQSPYMGFRVIIKVIEK